MQREIVETLALHKADGRLSAEGWARQPFWRYRRRAVAASRWRIKEWDYYAIVSPEKFAIAFTASNLGYAGLFAICFVDLRNGHCWQVDALEALPLARRAFPEVAAEGEIHFTSNKLSLHIESRNGQRTVRFSSPALDGPHGRGLDGIIQLAQPAALESMNIATSWAENRRAFYYNSKVNCLPASGSFMLGGHRYDLQPQRDLGVLDWGRGVWTYDNTWYWASASGYVDGLPLGFNFGYGFSDRSPASENVVIYAGRVHKLDQVSFDFDPQNWLKPWRVRSNDARVRLTFRPSVDRHSAINLLVISSAQHQVFGYFSGEVVLDDGRRLIINDLPGFAEEVKNRW